mmetsp:Transcript_30566/g.55424  ORF Transcript_30566/g.55424 Transcript_30566/m.55424 type:complete len:123 (+) Transcript_30566:696-1064(+)
MGRIGNLTETEFERARRSNNTILNCPATSTDITNARLISVLDRVETDCVAIPQEFLTVQFVTLVAYVMFVNQVPFLITLSRKMRFVTVQHRNQVSLQIKEKWYKIYTAQVLSISPATENSQK